MAKDVSGKSLSNQNSASNSPPTNSDQQKVPPLRIVLNSSGNQRGSSAIAVSSEISQDIKKEKHDAKTDGTSKTSGSVRIKLGIGKQAIRQNTSSTNDQSHKNINPDNQKLKTVNTDKLDSKEETSLHYSHLRRITRRSQRTIQSISNEDEESISSMTSTDENQITTNNNESDNNGNVQETITQTSSQSEATSTTTTVTTTSTTTNAQTASSTATNQSNNEPPRRYKRRKGETTECTLSEIDLTFGFQSYKLPNQNSFELYRNIRKQVDKKLKSLSSINTRVPYGFRDYMLNRGSYLLDGNKLGNGTSLLVNEDGDLYQPPANRWKSFRLPKVTYSVPTRAKVPPTLASNSPLYNLFIEQEKERYRMRMQHIKEREKLTLAAEQEIMRVYNQAAMAAADQDEPFSACTMLKHQEIYNYLDADGCTIQVNEDIQPDPMKQNGVRTRRRQHEHVSPPPARKSSNTDDSAVHNKEKDNTTLEGNAPNESQKHQETSQCKQGSKEYSVVDESSTSPSAKRIKTQGKDEEVSVMRDEEIKNDQKPVNSSSEPDDVKQSEDSCSSDSQKAASKDEVASETSKTLQVKSGSKSDEADNSNAEKSEVSKDLDKHSNTQNEIGTADKKEAEALNSEEEGKTITTDSVVNQTSASALVDTSKSKPEEILSDDDKVAQIRRSFLSALQQVDDKWERIRSEMLARHRNEAESLNAVQKLEWEWKAKEVGVCDVRTSLIIDNSYVPKLNIFSQDY